MVYNLLLGMCMRLKFMFLSTVIPDPNSPGRNIDVCIQSLINELKQLWLYGALTYNVSRKYNFLMKRTLMWTINDFLTYDKVFDWSMHEKQACSYFMENNKAFTLTNNNKTSFFTITSDSYQRTTSTEKTKRTSLLAGLKEMLHRRFFWVRNCMA